MKSERERRNHVYNEILIQRAKRALPHIIQQAKKLHLRVRFYSIEDVKNKPTITVCLLKDLRVLSRGISIRNYKDTPCAIVGKFFALCRAFRAHKKGGYEVFKNPLALNVVNVLELATALGTKYQTKTIFMDGEEKLFEIKDRKGNSKEPSPKNLDTKEILNEVDKPSECPF